MTRREHWLSLIAAAAIAWLIVYRLIPFGFVALLAALDVEPNAGPQKAAEGLPAVLEKYRNGTGPAAAVQQLVPMMLASQAERNWNHPRQALWRREFGEAIESLRDRGDLPDDAWAAYARESADFRPQVVDTVPRGAPIPLCLELLPRVGRARRFGVAYSAVFTIDEKITLPAPLHFAPIELDPQDGQTGPWFDLVLPTADAAALADGPHALLGKVEIDVFDLARPAAGPVAHRQASLFASYTQLPGHAASTRPGYDRDGCGNLARHLKVARLDRTAAGGDSVVLRLTTRGLADGYVCSVWLRQGRAVWPLAHAVELTPKADINLGGAATGLADGPIEVVVRPAVLDGAMPMASLNDPSYDELILPATVGPRAGPEK